VRYPSREHGGKKKNHGCHEKKTEEKSASKRTGRGAERWLELPLDLELAVADAEEEVDNIETAGLDVENPELDVKEVDVGGRPEVGGERDGDKVPTVSVLVPDRIDGVWIDWGMGIEDVAAGSGELNDPVIPVSRKNGEYPM